MVEPFTFERSASITMRVDVNQADSSLATNGAQDRLGDGMIAADTERDDTGSDDRIDVLFNILMALPEVEPAAEPLEAQTGLTRTNRNSELAR